MDERTRAEEMMGETVGFRHADFFRFAAVMTQDNMTQLAGQGALQQIERQALIVGDEIAKLAVLKVNGSNGVMLLHVEHGNQIVTIHADPA